jgi:uncharacterized Zn finger protein
MSYFSWRPYVPVAQRRREAEQELAKLAKGGKAPAPVTVEGRKIANSFWGKSWCENLEHYSDFASRLPRGRSYVRNGLVIDLKIKRGEVAAKVSGSDLYTVNIKVTPVKAPQWRAICRDCAGSIDSLVELLQGRLAKAVMERVCRKGDGLFPTPDEIELSCSCPDWADMCKHVAAALYGVGARLDEKPELLFVLRNVDAQELSAGASGDLALTRGKPSAKVLDDGDVAALFGLDMADAVDAGAQVAAVRTVPKRKVQKESKALAGNGPTVAKTKAAKTKAANAAAKAAPPRKGSGPRRSLVGREPRAAGRTS